MRAHVERMLAREAQAAAAAPVARPLRTRIAAAQKAARMFFSSGESNRLTGDWPTMPVPIDWIIHRYQRTLVARSRQLTFSNDYVKAYIRLQRQNIVGPAGIMFQSKATDGAVRAAIERAFRDWGKPEHCDVTGKRSWRALQGACVATAARDGEYFLREVFGRDAGKYGYALQMLDAQRCPVDYDREGLEGGAFIRHGIEFNRYGRPIAYHFNDTSGERSAMHYSYAGRSFQRIPADEIIHGFVGEFAGQKRGLPWLYSGLFRAHQMGAMEEATVVNARVGAAKMGFIQFKEGYGPKHDYDDEDLEIDAEAGAFPVLPEGAELSKFDPTYPNGELLPFVKLQLRALAAGGGVAYENLSHDRENVNFTSIRHGTLDERESYKDGQEWLTEELCERVFSRFLLRALLTGLIVTESGAKVPASAIEACEPHAWQPRRWDWVDPDADTKAAERAKNNLLTSFSRLVRERGLDPEEVWKEVAQDIQSMRAAGIPDEFIMAAMGQKIAAKAEPKERQE